MIGFLTGQPRSHIKGLLVMVNGVGYLVHVGQKTESELVHAAEVSLFIHTYVKPEALELYGFQTKEAYQVFQLLLSVSGVGPRTALAITDHPPQKIITAVQEAQTSFFTAVPRVGKKLAQKIIIELRSKLGELKELDLKPKSAKAQEVYEALSSLGLESEIIEDALTKIDVENQPIEKSITEILKARS